MARFVAGTAEPDGCVNFLTAFQSHLLANGWTVHDVLTSEVTNATFASYQAIIYAVNDFAAGAWVTVTGIDPPEYNGTFRITSAVAGNFRYYNYLVTPGLYASGGAAGPFDTVFKGTALDAVAGNAPFIRVTQGGAGRISFRCYTDWDPVTHTGANVAGAPTTQILDLTYHAVNYMIRANPYAFYVAFKAGGIF